MSVIFAELTSISSSFVLAFVPASESWGMDTAPVKIAPDVLHEGDYPLRE